MVGRKFLCWPVRSQPTRYCRWVHFGYQLRLLHQLPLTATVFLVQNVGLAIETPNQSNISLRNWRIVAFWGAPFRNGDIKGLLLNVCPAACLAGNFELKTDDLS